MNSVLISTPVKKVTFLDPDISWWSWLATKVGRTVPVFKQGIVDILGTLNYCQVFLSKIEVFGNVVVQVNEVTGNHDIVVFNVFVRISVGEQDPKKEVLNLHGSIKRSR